MPVPLFSCRVSADKIRAGARRSASATAAASRMAPMLRGCLAPGTQGLGTRKVARRLFHHYLRQTQSVYARPAEPVLIVTSEILEARVDSSRQGFGECDRSVHPRSSHIKSARLSFAKYQAWRSRDVRCGCPRGLRASNIDPAARWGRGHVGAVG